MFTVGHPFHGHVNGVLWRFIQLIKDDEVDGDGFEAHPRSHAPQVEVAVPYPLDVGGVRILDPFPNGLGVLVNEGIDTAFGKIGDISLVGEEIEDAPV